MNMKFSKEMFSTDVALMENETKTKPTNFHSSLENFKIAKNLTQFKDYVNCMFDILPTTELRKNNKKDK